MKVFITGIAGFIGMHTALSLQKEGYDVHGCDNYTPYYSPPLKKARTQILEKKSIHVRQADITDCMQLEEIFSKDSFDILIHLAAQPGVRHSITHPDSYIQTNLVGFYNILEICRKYSSLKLIYASSSSVYGLNEKIPYAENDQTDQPASLYGATKKANEIIAHSYHHLYQIPMTGLRFFTVYGPWGRPDMAYYSFTKNILAGEPIDLYNFGNVRRDFTYIDDIVDGIARAVKCKALGKIYNLGNQQAEPVLQLIKILEQLLNKKAEIRLKPPAQGDVVETFADLTLSAEELGFQPKTNIRQGLKEFVHWYLNYNEENAFGMNCNKSLANKQ